MAGMPLSKANTAQAGLANVYYYDTAVELLAATPTEGIIGYAIDTNALYIYAGSAWVALGSASGFLGTNGGTIGNETNNVWALAENSENLTLTYGSDLVTFASGTGATFILTPATAITGDLTLNGGAGALTFGAASSSVVVPDNSATALVLGSTGLLDLITLDTQDGVEKVVIGGDLQVNGEYLTPPGMLESFAEGAAGKGIVNSKFDYTAWSATAQMLNYTSVGNGHKFAMFPIVAQTLTPVMSATGLNIGADQTDNDGMEMVSGFYGATGRPYIIGTDPAFKFCATVTVDDVSGVDDFHIGFREVADLPNGTFTNYTDFATLGWSTNADPADLNTVTDLDNAGEVTTATTDTVADGANVKYCVLVGAAGATTYTVDGTEPTTVVAYTFGDGLMVAPFIHYIQHGDLSEAITVTEWESVYQ